MVLLIAAMGLLVVALGTGHAALAWGSVALSVVVAALILKRWRRSWLQRQDAPEEDFEEEEDELIDAESGGQPLQPTSVTARQQEVIPDSPTGEGDFAEGGGQSGEMVLAEEDTDAADLLVVYELEDEVLVMDEHPRYHLARCRLPDYSHVEHLPVREARQLGFTPCARCRPDTTLARKHRADRATATESS